MGNGSDLAHPVSSPEISSSCLLEDNRNNLTLMGCGVGVWQNLVKRGIDFLKLRTIFISSCRADYIHDLWLVLHAIQSSIDVSLEEKPKPVTIFGPVGTAKNVAKLVDVFGPIDTKKWLRFQEGPALCGKIETFPVGNGLGICLDVRGRKIIQMENTTLSDLEDTKRRFGKIEILVAGTPSEMVNPALIATLAFTKQMAHDVIIVNADIVRSGMINDLCVKNGLMYGMPMMMIPF